jgi:hypothetical protein
MIVIQTQYRENYGTADEPYWKFKGGSEYKVTNVPDMSEEEVTELVMSLRDRIEYRESMSEEYVTDWFTAPDTYLSWFEKSQLEFDGEITFKEPTINYEELVNG